MTEFNDSISAESKKIKRRLEEKEEEMKEAERLA